LWRIYLASLENFDKRNYLFQSGKIICTLKEKPMPQSKSRHAHKHAHPPSKTPPIHPKPKDNNRVILIAVLFFGFLGLAIGYFIGRGIATLLTATILGVAAGFIFGYSIKKSFSGK
jgi:uncharacterized membrane protein